MWAFALAHPFLAFFLAWFLMDYVAKTINRVVRSRNVKNAGWPPAHLDADGDFKDE